MALTDNAPIQAAEIRKLLKETISKVQQNFTRMQQLAAQPGVIAALGTDDAAQLATLYASVKQFMHDAAGIDLPALEG